MKAYYYRYLYQNTVSGTIHTASAVGEKGAFCLCYMCSDGTPVREAGTVEERFKRYGEKLSVLVVENLHAVDLEEVGRILKEHHVEKVFLPYGDSAAELPDLHLAEEVRILKAGEEVSFREAGWNVWLKCLPSKEQGTLVLYHGPSEETKSQQDCVLTAKPFNEKLPCQVCVDAENHACGMKCCLYNDYTLCKGHNDREFEGYVTGALLLGNVDMNLQGEELKEGVMKYRKDIRLVTLPIQGAEEKNSDTFLHFLCEENADLNRYYVLPERTNEKVLKDVLRRGPRQITVLTNKEKGFCLSGFFTEKK